MDTFFSLMRLGKKYLCDDVFNTCLDRLPMELPITLEAFDNASPLRFLDGDRPYIRNSGTLIKVINQSVDLGIECVLPCAFYLMMTHFQLQVRLAKHM
jgi:hypothetical protein